MTLSSDRIALSWERASMYGLNPAWLPSDVDISPVAGSSRLLDAARPVMDRLAAIFAGMDCSVILADRNVRLVDIRHGNNGIDHALTENGAVTGRLARRSRRAPTRSPRCTSSANPSRCAEINISSKR